MENSPLRRIFGNTVVKMIIALTLVGVVSGATLVMVYNATIDKIKFNVNQAQDRAIREIFKDADKIEETKEEGVFKVTDKEGKLLGYAFTAEGNGYQGIIKMIAGVDPEFTKLNGMEVIESQETPGLGAEIAGTPFRSQFEGLSITHPIEYVKNQKPVEPYQIEAITGATISSRAVVNILNIRIGEIKKVLRGEG